MGSHLKILSEFKKGNLIIYPETAIFKCIKIIPTSFVKSTAEKALRKANEKAFNDK